MGSRWNGFKYGLYSTIGLLAEIIPVPSQIREETIVEVVITEPDRLRTSLSLLETKLFK
jgi:hypothetical protein